MNTRGVRVIGSQLRVCLPHIRNLFSPLSAVTLLEFSPKADKSVFSNDLQECDQPCQFSLVRTVIVLALKVPQSGQPLGLRQTRTAGHPTQITDFHFSLTSNRGERESESFSPEWLNYSRSSPCRPREEGGGKVELTGCYHQANQLPTCSHMSNSA